MTWKKKNMQKCVTRGLFIRPSTNENVLFLNIQHLTNAHHLVGAKFGCDWLKWITIP